MNTVLFAYRDVPQQSLEFLPFELFGWTMRRNMGILIEICNEEVSEGEVKTTHQYVCDLREKLEATCRLAHQVELRQESYG